MNRGNVGYDPFFTIPFVLKKSVITTTKLLISIPVLSLMIVALFCGCSQFSQQESYYYSLVIGSVFGEEMGFDYDSPYIEVNGRTREVMAIHPVDPNGLMGKAGLKDRMVVVGIEGLERLSITGFYKTIFESQGKIIKIFLVAYENGPPIKDRPQTVLEVLVPDISNRHEVTEFSMEEHYYYHYVIGNAIQSEIGFWLEADHILAGGRSRSVIVMDSFFSKELMAKAGGNRWMIVAGIEGLDQLCMTGFYKTLHENRGKKVKIILVDRGDGLSLEDRPKTVIEVLVPQ